MKMKTILPLLVASLSFITSVLGHESVTIGPNGGRILFVDSTITPNVEIRVNKEAQAEIALLDKDRQPIPIDEQTIVVNAGPRRSVKTLDVEVKAGKFITSTVPSDAPYYIVMQLKETRDSKAITLRLNYDPTPAESGKPTYLDDSVNESSGENIGIPGTAKGIWAELNQHQKELDDAVPSRNYEAIDEITRAFPKLAQGLPPVSADKEASATLVETLVTHLHAIHEANAARELEDAKTNVEGVAATIGELKKLYPQDVANAQLN